MTKKKKRTIPVRPIYTPLSRDKIINIWEDSKHLGRRLRLNFSLLYLTGARVSEVINLRKQDFIYDTDDQGEEVFRIRLATLKNRKKPFRELPIGVKIDPYIPMIKEIEGYISHLDDYQKLYSVKDRSAIWRQLRKIEPFTTTAIGYKKREFVETTRHWYPHFFRHTRITHLVQHHNANPMELMQWAGWTDPRLANVYFHGQWQDLATLLKQKKVPVNY